LVDVSASGKVRITSVARTGAADEAGAAGHAVAGVAVGADGSPVVATTRRVLRLGTAGGPTTTLFALPTGSTSHVANIATAPDGSIWFEAVGGQAFVGRIAPTGVVQQINVPYQLETDGMVVGSDGAAWLAINGGAVRVTPDGQTITRSQGGFLLLRPCSVDAAGNLVGAASEGRRLARVAPDGQVTLLPQRSRFPMRGCPAVGADGNYWFAGDLIDAWSFAGPSRSFTVPQRYRVIRVPRYGGEMQVLAGPRRSLWTGTAYRVLQIRTSGRILPYTVRYSESQYNGEGPNVFAASSTTLWAAPNGRSLTKLFRIAVG
jgi:sugar lactone lactonase YvrE